MINYRLNRGRLVHMEYLQKDADLVSLIVPSTARAPSRAVYLVGRNDFPKSPARQLVETMAYAQFSKPTSGAAPGVTKSKRLHWQERA